MKTIALWGGALLLAHAVWPATGDSEPPRPSGEATTEAAAMPWEDVCRLAPEPTAPGAVPKQRPDEIWWPSPDEYLRAIFGPCGPRPCCRRCTTGKACGDTCIERADTCRTGCGCACDDPSYFVIGGSGGEAPRAEAADAKTGGPGRDPP